MGLRHVTLGDIFRRNAQLVPDRSAIVCGFERISHREYLKRTEHLAAALSGLSIGGGVNWNGDQPARALNPGTGEEELIGQKSFAVVDLLAQYRFNDSFSAQLNVENLLDEEYVSRNAGWWGGPYVWGAPRNWRMWVTYQFR